MKHTVVIGGGASGMTAAIAAAEQGAPVTLIEKKEQLGKKLQVTGNGHCNFSNAAMDASHYHSDDAAFLSACLKAFTPADAAAFFKSLGMLSHERNGYYYPLSEQASTVVRTLKTRLQELGVRVLTGTNVLQVRKAPDGFVVSTGKETMTASEVILSCGSEASVRDPRPFTAYRILRDFGLSVAEPFPALVPLFGNEGIEAFWDGVRHVCTVRTENGAEETGEVQFTKKGLSGIPVFQLSHDAVKTVREKGACTLFIDFLPGIPEEEIRAHLTAQADRKLETVLGGMLPAKLGPVTAKKAGIGAFAAAGAISPAETERLLNALKSFEYGVTGYGGMEDAQVSAGGLSLKELTADCEVSSVPGLFVTGELLNADGACGGYNLHFAFATGLIAGRAAGRRVPEA
ncbi:MAG: aminoacetone oxidase family FAD-binding enzyme [Lachnospiraceae bacterium]|nr:aminoacetone oxidase family FAD-binding enzyme [Lachnospiraceae bacterium]